MDIDIHQPLPVISSGQSRLTEIPGTARPFRQFVWFYFT
jgi:hypothetical protein